MIYDFCNIGKLIDRIICFCCPYTFLVRTRCNHFTSMDTVQVVELVKAFLRDTADGRKTGSSIGKAGGARLAPGKTA